MLKPRTNSKKTTAKTNSLHFPHNGINKRKKERVIFNSDLYAQVKYDESHIINTKIKIKDISEIGLGLKSPRHIIPHNKIIITIHISKETTITTTGFVVYSKRINKDFFLVGIETSDNLLSLFAK